MTGATTTAMEYRELLLKGFVGPRLLRELLLKGFERQRQLWSMGELLYKEFVRQNFVATGMERRDFFTGLSRAAKLP